ncbi:hypothetical protein P0Y35_07555 [Kiritimatiellaeota bacterium B1221]|nr:hypothetical protein [Kiritimatiellaeota bacterium B1221]
MNTETLTTFFAWSTTFHIVFLLLCSVVIMGFRKPIAQIHAKITGLSEAELYSLYFRFLANYKLGLLLFSLVPYLALRLMAS